MGNRPLQANKVTKFSQHGMRKGKIGQEKLSNIVDFKESGQIAADDTKSKDVGNKFSRHSMEGCKIGSETVGNEESRQNAAGHTKAKDAASIEETKHDQGRGVVTVIMNESKQNKEKVADLPSVEENASVGEPKHDQARGPVIASTNESMQDAAVLPLVEENGKHRKRNILLVGKRGLGKSTLGNSIFGTEDKVFETSDAMGRETDDIICKSKEVDGLKITICDALTIPDEENRELIETRLNQCFKECPDGFHCIMFVFKYAFSIIEEYNVTAEILQNVFKESCVTDQWFSVFTDGESFDRKKKENEGFNFETWYKEVKLQLPENICHSMQGFLVYHSRKNEMMTQRQKILEAVRNCDKSMLKHVNVPNIDQVPRPCWENSSTSQIIRCKPAHNDLGIEERVAKTNIDLLLIDNLEPEGENIASILKGQEEDRIDHTIRTPRTITRSTARKINGGTLKIFDGGLLGLLLRDGKYPKHVIKIQDILKDSFEHFQDGFQALVVVLNRQREQRAEEAVGLQNLESMLGKSIWHCCILICPCDETHTSANTCQNCNIDDVSKYGRVLFVDKRMLEKKELISQQITEMICSNSSSVQRYTKEMFEAVSSKREQYVANMLLSLSGQKQA